MSKRNSTLLKLALVAMIFAAGVSLNWQSSFASQDLPPGKGVELANAKCVTCHEADLIMAQRLTKQGWTREVEKMVRWGASVNDAEKAILVDYFSEHFAPRKAAQPVALSSTERGKQVFEDKCLLCHEVDLVEQQRLGKPGWTREVEKMVRWGATVTDAEKEPLVEYLVSTYGPRPLVPKK
ncbi:MAG: hypothetical protein JNK38_12585 [Acidobacteria bacterium]|nr:hypothetical protein [Acidobacteriota bacterium]